MLYLEKGSDQLETRYIIGLVVGLFIYISAVSGLYLVFKDDIAYQREQMKKAKAKRKKARELAAIAKTMTSSDKKEIEIENLNDESIKEEEEK